MKKSSELNEICNYVNYRMLCKNVKFQSHCAWRTQTASELKLKAYKKRAVARR